MPSTDVLICGAGPTGLVLALWLTKFGIKVRIIDRTAEPGTTSADPAVGASRGAVMGATGFGIGSRCAMGSDRSRTCAVRAIAPSSFTRSVRCATSRSGVFDPLIRASHPLHASTSAMREE